MDGPHAIPTKQSSVLSSAAKPSAGLGIAVSFQRNSLPVRFPVGRASKIHCRFLLSFIRYPSIEHGSAELVNRDTFNAVSATSARAPTADVLLQSVLKHQSRTFGDKRNSIVLCGAQQPFPAAVQVQPSRTGFTSNAIGGDATIRSDPNGDHASNTLGLDFPD